MIIHSIRWRLQVWYGLILVLVLSAFGVTAYKVAQENQLRRIDQDLEPHFGVAFRPPPPGEGGPWGSGGHGGPGGGPEGEKRGPEDRRPGMRGPRFDPEFFRQRIQDSLQRAVAYEAGQTNTSYFVFWRGDGKLLVRSLGAPEDVPMPVQEPPQMPPEPQTNTMFFERRGGPELNGARTRGSSRELYKFMPQGDCLLVGRSIAPDIASMRLLGGWLVVAGAAVLLLGLAGGWWVATRAIQPIEEISGTAVKIAAGDLSQRINAADASSELGKLAGVLNSTFARLEAAFANQARFTSDASHELRTPISVV